MGLQFQQPVVNPLIVRPATSMKVLCIAKVATANHSDQVDMVLPVVLRDYQQMQEVQVLWYEVGISGFMYFTSKW